MYLIRGGSAKKVIDVVRSIGGEVTGVAVLCNRGGVTAHDLGDVPELISLANVQMDAWDEQDCPLCSQEVPINTEVGKGREYLARK
jgi:orotate phosphoribosyltransferase